MFKLFGNIKLSFISLVLPGLLALFPITAEAETSCKDQCIKDCGESRVCVSGCDEKCSSKTGSSTAAASDSNKTSTETYTADEKKKCTEKCQGSTDATCYDICLSNMQLNRNLNDDSQVGSAAKARLDALEEESKNIDYSGIYNKKQLLPNLMAIYCKANAEDMVKDISKLHECVRKYIEHASNQEASAQAEGREKIRNLTYKAWSDVSATALTKIANIPNFNETYEQYADAGNKTTTAHEDELAVSSTTSVLTDVIDSMRELYAENAKASAIEDIGAVDIATVKAVEDLRLAQQAAAEAQRKADEEYWKAQEDAAKKQIDDEYAQKQAEADAANAQAQGQENTEESEENICTGGSFNLCTKACDENVSFGMRGACYSQCSKTCPDYKESACTGGSYLKCTRSPRGSLSETDHYKKCFSECGGCPGDTLDTCVTLCKGYFKKSETECRTICSNRGCKASTPAWSYSSNSTGSNANSGASSNTGGNSLFDNWGRPRYTYYSEKDCLNAGWTVTDCSRPGVIVSAPPTGGATFSPLSPTNPNYVH